MYSNGTQSAADADAAARCGYTLKVDLKLIFGNHIFKLQKDE